MEHMDNKMKENMKGSMKTIDLVNLEDKFMEHMDNKMETIAKIHLRSYKIRRILLVQVIMCSNIHRRIKVRSISRSIP